MLHDLRTAIFAPIWLDTGIAGFVPVYMYFSISAGLLEIASSYEYIAHLAPSMSTMPPLLVTMSIGSTTVVDMLFGPESLTLQHMHMELSSLESV